jgi:hypothetical protein
MAASPEAIRDIVSGFSIVFNDQNAHVLRFESSQDTRLKQKDWHAGWVSDAMLPWWENVPQAFFSLETGPLFGTSLRVTNLYSFRKLATDAAAYGRACEACSCSQR